MKKLKFPDGREGISCGSIWEIPEGRGSYENPFRVEYEYFLELHIGAGMLPFGGGGLTPL